MKALKSIFLTAVLLCAPACKNDNGPTFRCHDKESGRWVLIFDRDNTQTGPGGNPAPDYVEIGGPDMENPVTFAGKSIRDTNRAIKEAKSFCLIGKTANGGPVSGAAFTLTPLPDENASGIIMPP